MSRADVLGVEVVEEMEEVIEEVAEVVEGARLDEIDEPLSWSVRGGRSVVT